MSTERQDEERSKSIKHLRGENYSSWKFQVRQTLKGKALWKTVHPGTPPVEGATEAEKDAWQSKCARAYTIVALLCEANIQADIRAKEAERVKDNDGEGQEVEEDQGMTPKDLWSFLKEEYASTSVHAQIRIRRQLTETLGNPKASMRDHLAEVSDLYIQLAETGAPVKEAYLKGRGPQIAS
ncbi:unnamed protein product [Tilletia controversa]|nr:unnamed protein product [Tilletia controversa]CAD6968966.1 unnamed protein product [Tilletia controversa]